MSWKEVERGEGGQPTLLTVVFYGRKMCDYVEEVINSKAGRRGKSLVRPFGKTISWNSVPRLSVLPHPPTKTLI